MEFQLKHAADIQYLYLTFGKAAAAFSTRLGGASEGCYSGLNLALHVGDRAETVIENRNRFLEIFKLSPDRLVTCSQIHGAEVYQAADADSGKGGRTSAAAAEADALITDVPGLPLGLFSADCLLIFFYDYKTPAIGIAHAGWKGSTAGVAVAAVNKMKQQFGSCLNDITAAFSPAIGPCCYEVGQDVALAARGSGEEKYLLPAGNGHYRFSLIEYNRCRLADAGLNAEKMIFSNYCTACNNDLFFSYRKADRGITGRMMGIISLTGEADNSDL